MLGEVLRTERERQHLTIHDIEQGTSIRAVYIEAIEAGDYKRLPGDVYTKGFIKNYASFLNLNAEELVNEFVNERNPQEIIDTEKNVAVETANVETEEKVSRIKITDLTETNMKLPKRKTEDSDSAPSSNSGSGFKLVAAVVVLAVIAAGVWTYISGFEISDVDTNHRQEQPANVAETQKTPSASVDDTEKNVTNTASAAIPQTGVNIQAKFTGECWTQVIADGLLVYEDTATAGQVLHWEGKENVTVTVGNAGVVEFTNNGRHLGSLGSYGEVTERTFTATSNN